METIDVIDEDYVIQLIRDEGVDSDSMDMIWKNLEALNENVQRLNKRLEERTDARLSSRERG